MTTAAIRVLVLLVEDDPTLMMSLEDTLQDGGYEPVVARNGAEAIAALDADDGLLKAVITDIRLGRGPDGWEVGRHARHLRPDIPVIYATGDSAAEWAEKGVPNSLILQKPFAMAQLIVALSTLLNDAAKQPIIKS